MYIIVSTYGYDKSVLYNQESWNLDACSGVVKPWCMYAYKTANYGNAQYVVFPYGDLSGIVFAFLWLQQWGLV